MKDLQQKTGDLEFSVILLKYSHKKWFLSYMSKIMKYMEMPISASKKLLFSVFHDESVSTELIDCYTAFYTRTPKIKLRC